MFIVSIARFKSASLQHDVHLVNNGHIWNEINSKEEYELVYGLLVIDMSGLRLDIMFLVRSNQDILSSSTQKSKFGHFCRWRTTMWPLLYQLKAPKRWSTNQWVTSPWPLFSIQGQPQYFPQLLRDVYDLLDARSSRVLLQSLVLHFSNHLLLSHTRPFNKLNEKKHGYCASWHNLESWCNLSSAVLCKSLHTTDAENTHTQKLWFLSGSAAVFSHEGWADKTVLGRRHVFVMSDLMRPPHFVFTYVQMYICAAKRLHLDMDLICYMWWMCVCGLYVGLSGVRRSYNSLLSK